MLYFKTYEELEKYLLLEVDKSDNSSFYLSLYPPYARLSEKLYEQLNHEMKKALDQYKEGDMIEAFFLVLKDDTVIIISRDDDWGLGSMDVRAYKCSSESKGVRDLYQKYKKDSLISVWIRSKNNGDPDLRNIWDEITGGRRAGVQKIYSKLIDGFMCTASISSSLGFEICICPTEGK